MILYQTLENRENPEYVEQHGPFKCINPTAWLGHGFYFWDSHIQLGHWWGSQVHGDSYIICSCNATLDNTCWDLHGNGDHRLEFIETCKRMINERLTTAEKLLVPHVITFMVKENIFPYKAIRALSMNVVGFKQLKDSTHVFRVKFYKKNHSYLDLYPPVQVCLLEKRALSLHKYLVVYPDEYVDQLYA